MTTTPPELPSYGGCLWPVDPACFTEQWDALTPDVQDRSLALASATLRRLTGGRVGGCPIRVRPVSQRGACFIPYDMTGMFAPGSGAFYPGMNSLGHWVNVVSEVESLNSGTVALPRPVGRVDEVKVNGEVLSPTDYQIEDGNILRWMGTGLSPFPATQDLSLPDTEPGTMSVTYLNSYPVDSIGAHAVGVLAMEYAKACGGSKACRLPSGVTSIVRQGVSMEIASGAFPGGLTGIREVDAFITLWNPRGLAQPPAVWTPGRRRHSMNTAGGGVAPADVLDGGTP